MGWRTGSVQITGTVRQQITKSKSEDIMSLLQLVGYILTIPTLLWILYSLLRHIPRSDNTEKGVLLTFIVGFVLSCLGTLFGVGPRMPFG